MVVPKLLGHRLRVQHSGDAVESLAILGTAFVPPRNPPSFHQTREGSLDGTVKVSRFRHREWYQVRQRDQGWVVVGDALFDGLLHTAKDEDFPLHIKECSRTQVFGRRAFDRERDTRQALLAVEQEAVEVVERTCATDAAADSTLGGAVVACIPDVKRTDRPALVE